MHVDKLKAEMLELEQMFEDAFDDFISMKSLLADPRYRGLRAHSSSLLGVEVPEGKVRVCLMLAVESHTITPQDVKAALALFFG